MVPRTVNATRRTARKTSFVPPGLAAVAVGLDGLARSPGVGLEGHEVLHGSALFVVSLDPQEQPATRAWTRRRPAPMRDKPSCSSGGQRVRPLTGPSGASRGWAGSGEASGAGRSLSCWPSAARKCARAAPAWARAVAAAVLLRSTAGGW